ncbi:predicted protein [Naegleria gruberi]|uniref:Predicted protein n=1 Tax=Naegleria gruberi TaxID=5762 RepID=D2VPZ2_NAEGR|nr:uncharacterized protein NAEGRDRAFT_71106 [Naegleria gruberi]EFC41090.1 predicted protein [Naegleria gruberi]|eukprot:XP_002673834.1 predicted protein [Naegleria gruberi strain NEG-M]
MSFDGLVFKKLSEKKQNKKKTTRKILPSNKKENRETIILIDQEQELNNDDLNVVVDEKVSNKELEINLDLDVSQPLSLFFDALDPQVIILSGTAKYDENYKYLMKNEFTWYNYKSKQEMLEKKLEYPRFEVEHYPRAKSFSFVQQLLSRTEYLSCMSSDCKFLFVYGGRTGNVMHDDFISYDIASNVLYVYKNLYLACHGPFYKNIRLPIGLIGYEMIELDQLIFIFGKGEIHRIEKVTDPLNLSYLTQVERSALPNRIHFTMTKVLIENKLYLYVFGGKSDKGVLDENLYMIYFNGASYNPFTCTTYSPPKQFKELRRWPSARYGHSACKVSNSIFIYGGVTTGDKILNDLFMLDISSKTWTEIIVQSIIPPPLFKHCSFSVNERSFFIYGGNKSEGISDCFYGYDIIDNKWNFIEIVSDEMKQNISGYKCLTTLKGEVFAIGSSQKEKNHRSFSKLLNVGDSFKSVSVLQYLNQKREEGYLCDVSFQVNDLAPSSSSPYILAHKCIIKARCPILYQKIQSSKQWINTNQLEGVFLEKEMIIVDIAECDSNTLMKYLKYLYTGTIHLKASESLPFLSFVQATSEQKHYPIIQKIYSSAESKNIETTMEILNTIQNDFNTLLGDSVDSDLTLVLDNNNETANQGTNEEVIIHAHRLFLSRSPFFSKMLVSSGMLETIEKTVHLKDYYKEVMIDMLKYLYTDRLQLNPNNALGLLIYSLLFDMDELASCCRTLVASLLDKSNVCSIFEVATFHNDKALQNACENFMVDNFQSLSQLPHLLKQYPNKQEFPFNKSMKSSARKSSKKRRNQR